MIVLSRAFVELNDLDIQSDAGLKSSQAKVAGMIDATTPGTTPMSDVGVSPMGSFSLQRSIQQRCLTADTVVRQFVSDFGASTFRLLETFSAAVVSVTTETLRLPSPVFVTCL